jgi:2-iminobutanoate/2-iminopropanoate deaminase
VFRRTGSTNRAPRPAGPYSQFAAATGEVVALAGQVGRLPDGTLLDGIDAQAPQAFANLLAVADAAGVTQGDIVSVRVFLTDVSQFPVMNAAFADAFTEPYPARTTVYVGLGTGLLVEVDALAVRRTD